MLQYCIKQILKNINQYILHVFYNKIERQAIFFIFNTNPGFPHFYYMLGANLGLLLYGEVSVMDLHIHIKKTALELALYHTQYGKINFKYWDNIFNLKCYIF